MSSLMCPCPDCFQKLSAMYNSLSAEYKQTKSQLDGAIDQLNQTINSKNMTIQSLDNRVVLGQKALSSVITEKNEMAKEKSKFEQLYYTKVQMEKKLREQHVKDLNSKDLVIQELDVKLTASKKESVEKILELQEQLEEKSLEIQELKLKWTENQKLREHHANEMSYKDLKIQELETRLAACLKESQELEEQKKLKIQELETKLTEIEMKGAEEIRKAETHLAAVKEQNEKKILELQEQKAKEIGVKDLEIQQLAVKLVGSLEENLAKIQEVNNLNLKIQKLEEDSLETERRLQNLVEMLKEAVQKKEQEMVADPEPTQLHIELGKLYVELREAKKPQNELLAQKEKEIEYLRMQQEAKVAALTAENGNLTEMVRDGMEKNDNLLEIIKKLQKMMAVQDRKIDAMTRDLEKELGN